jgi:coproporphyrinogen III oxidase
LYAELQGALCERLQAVDGAGRFIEDRWEHPTGGGGASRVLTGGKVFERAGVNLAAVAGKLTPHLADKLGVGVVDYFATGVSLVVHPLSPLVPTVHMNLRYLETPRRRWFGGGADLTPYYLFEEDVRHFHSTLKSVCDRHDPALYPRFKRQCDEYFYLPHRREARGVGGIFFDGLTADPEQVLAFAADLGRSFPDAYLPIVERRAREPWWERERDWQLVRRGRYVEFNLVHDRGTLFGLETGGRTESILMSLPPLVRWRYDHAAEPGSAEEAMVRVLREPREWV